MDTRKDLARRRAVRALQLVREGLQDEVGDDLSVAADAVGVARSTFYRLLAKTPEKIDVIFLASVADWLHDAYGHEDFATMWRRVTREIQ